MKLEHIDFYLMDYDTYHQTIGNSYQEYSSWIQQINLKRLEDFTLRKKEKNQHEKSTEKKSLENTKKEDSNSSLEIFLFLLEFLSNRYGSFCPSPNFKNLSTQEKIWELFSFYESIGLSRESTIDMVFRYYHYPKKIRVKKYGS